MQKEYKEVDKFQDSWVRWFVNYRWSSWVTWVLLTANFVSGYLTCMWWKG